MQKQGLSTSTKDQDYIDAIRTHNNRKILEIYELYFGKVAQFVINNQGTRTDAKDIFDQAIYQISARLSRESFEIKSSFEAFLFTACKNLWRRELNKRKTKRVTNQTVHELYYEEKQLTLSTIEQERWELFREKLNELSENCKTILEHYFSNWSAKQIMEEYGYKTETTVRQRIFKCKNQLIKLVEKDPRYIKLKRGS